VLDRGYANISELRYREVHANIKICIAPPQSARAVGEGMLTSSGIMRKPRGVGSERGLGCWGGAEHEKGQSPEGPRPGRLLLASGALVKTRLCFF
jgi:hypothetical protein